MAKKTSFDDAARSPIAEGVKKLSRAVKSTLGPRGRNVVLDKGWGAPKVTKDGVTVAEDIVLDDPEENLGAALVKQAASKTNQTAGDGTTTATVLAEAIFLEGLKMVAAGADPMALSRGIQKAAGVVGEYVDKLATPVNDKSRKEIAQVASIAGNNDSTIPISTIRRLNSTIRLSSCSRIKFRTLSRLFRSSKLSISKVVPCLSLRKTSRARRLRRLSSISYAASFRFAP